MIYSYDIFLINHHFLVSKHAMTETRNRRMFFCLLWIGMLLCFNCSLAKIEKDLCPDAWPSLSLILPINVREGPRSNEWEDIFLKSFLFFWPYEISNTKITILVDEEQQVGRSAAFYEKFSSRVSYYKKKYPSLGFEIKSNNFSAEYWNHDGHSRQQLLMFFADKYTDSEFVGFVDTDSFFISYVSAEDIFKNNRPVILGRVGIPQNSFWKDIPASTSWLMKGKLEPLRCMSFFPFVIRRSDIIAMRSYFESIHNQPFLDIFQHYSAGGKFSQFNGMCAYLWYEQKDFYHWNVRVTEKDWMLKSSNVPGMSTDMKIYEAWMLVPLPRIAVHTRYHKTSISKLVEEGYCRSPPSDKKLPSRLDCSKYVNTSLFRDMHNFENTDFLAAEDKNIAAKYQKDRFDRISSCSHSYDLSLFPSLGH